MLNIYKSSIDLGSQDLLIQHLEQFRYCDLYKRVLAQVDDGAAGSTYPVYIHRDRELADIVPQILAHAELFTGCKDYRLEVMWANQQKRGGAGQVHDHKGYPLTCVVYVNQTGDDMGNIYFVTDDGEQEMVVRTGDILLFSGAIKHGVRPNGTDSIRRSIAGHLSKGG
jgi:hypothetical protein